MTIDPRAFSKEKLKPTHPLPMVSRKALKRVKDQLPQPADCRYCGSPVRIATHQEVYIGRSFGNWPYMYLCDGCGAYVGIHEGTDLPLGTLANEELRMSRKTNKRIFIVVIAGEVMKRAEGYKWLAGEMNIPVSECHWGWFDLDRCAQAGEICTAKIIKSMGI